MLGYYSEDELQEFGFKTCGANVLISKKASIYLPHKISIGHDVRIDDFCLLVGDITIGNYVHIAPYSSIHGTGGGTVVLKDFSGIGSYTGIYAGTDDLGGSGLTNPMAGAKFEHIISSDIILEKYSTTAAQCLILPNAYLAEGSVLGAKALLNRTTEPWGIYLGNPARRFKDRPQDAKEIGEALSLNNMNN